MNFYSKLRKELEKEAKLKIREITKIRKRLRSEYLKKIPKPKWSDNLFQKDSGMGKTEWRTWSDTEENLFKWVKILLSFEKEKLEKYKNISEVIFNKVISL